MPSSSPTSSASTTKILSAGWAICNRSRSAPAGWWSTPGLHAKRWTRQQAIEWFASTNGSSVEEVTGEVDRYCAWPGQACGYKVGHSEINRLRAKAQKALGERFDLRKFNDAVVTGGGVPMLTLGRVIDRFIADNSG